ncbi:hypothetical protein [Solemya velum gill symbiont]|uniref:hypothetical protein n=1 Tax=Solemya velum gill symbiont TaxID=2340 RepID=UPI0009966025|nr:hypothetical protein [Solemya velum gill symbiont]OOY72070.1 hypothetical protein BOW09_12310 [Solemya velum gill symbiont]
MAVYLKPLANPLLVKIHGLMMIVKKPLHSAKETYGISNVSLLIISQAQARRTVRQTRKNFRRDYVSPLDNRTSPKSVWRTIRSMNGKGGGSNGASSHLSDHNTTIADTLHIADIGDKFSHNSSSSSCSDALSAHRAKPEQHPLNFKSSNFDYNVDYIQDYPS